jgi:uncharacterized membrane protein YgcG
MKRYPVGHVVLAFLMLFGAGCASRTRRVPENTYTVALALTIEGGAQPTAAQWLAVKKPVARALADRGWLLIDDLSTAHHVIRVHFIPDPLDPERIGQATVVSMQPNPTRSVARYPSHRSQNLGYRDSYSRDGYYHGGYHRGSYDSYHDTGYRDSSSRTERSVNPPARTDRADHPRSDGGSYLPRVADIPMSSSSGSSHSEPSSSSSSGSSSSGSSGSSDSSGSGSGGGTSIGGNDNNVHPN